VLRAAAILPALDGCLLSRACILVAVMVGTRWKLLKYCRSCLHSRVVRARFSELLERASGSALRKLYSVDFIVGCTMLGCNPESNRLHYLGCCILRQSNPVVPPSCKGRFEEAKLALTPLDGLVALARKCKYAIIERTRLIREVDCISDWT